MIRFMVVCFLILGWVFYEMSGGSEFEPERRAEADPVVAPVQDALPEPDVEVALSDPIVTEADGSIQERLASALVTSAVTEAVLDRNLGEGVAQDIAAAIETATEAVPEEIVAAATQAVTETLTPDPTPVDVRRVAGSRVNMRSGPSTDFSVLDTLDSGTATEVIDSDANGWVLIRVQSTGQEGWMAERLLERING